MRTINNVESVSTFLPTWLLCRLNAVRASFPFSSLSMKRLVSFSPYLVLSLHPPHSHSRSPCSCFLVLPHLHPGILLRAHWRVISCVMAALLMAWRKPVSRVAVKIKDYSGSLYVFGKMPKNPSLKPTFCLRWEVSDNNGLGTLAT